MYYIIELQTANSTPAHIVQTASTRNEAMSKYHQVLASAAISQVDVHACTIIDDHGISIAREVYVHNEEPVVQE